MRARVTLACLVLLGGHTAFPRATSFAVETGFLDRTTSVNGHSYRYQVYVPPDYDPAKAWPVVMWLHGNGTQGEDGLLQTARGLAEYIRLRRKEFAAIAVFPQAPPGGNWIEPDTQAIAVTALDKTLAEFKCDPARVSLVSYSMGAVGGYRIASRWPERFSALIAVAGRVEVSTLSERLAQFDRTLHPYVNASDPFAALADRLKPVAIRMYHGDKDATISVEQSRRLFAALKIVGADVTFTELAGVDHNGAPDKALSEPGLFAWLLSQTQGSKK